MRWWKATVAPDGVSKDVREVYFQGEGDMPHLAELAKTQATMDYRIPSAYVWRIDSAPNGPPESTLTILDSKPAPVVDGSGTIVASREIAVRPRAMDDMAKRIAILENRADAAIEEKVRSHPLAIGDMAKRIAILENRARDVERTIVSGIELRENLLKRTVILENRADAFDRTLASQASAKPWEQDFEKVLIAVQALDGALQAIVAHLAKLLAAQELGPSNVGHLEMPIEK